MLFLGHPGLFVVFLSFCQQALFSGSLMILRADMTVCRYFYAQTPAEEAYWKKKLYECVQYFHRSEQQLL